MKGNKHQASALEEMMKQRNQEELPPRSQTHKKQNQKKKLKLKHPLIRFFALCFLLVPIAVLAYTYYGPGKDIPEKAYDKIQLNKNEQHKSNKEEIKGELEKKEETETQPTKKEENEVSPIIPENLETKYTIHTVTNGETLYMISMKYYGTRDGESLIKSMNQIQGNELTTGQQLKIPAKEYIEMK